jgi:hypothetical protein
MKTCWAAGLVLLASCCAFAQNATRIDGRLHPELISDNSAYRAVFLMHSHFATETETARSEQFHANIGLGVGDHQIYDEILKGFRDQYEVLVGTHNAFIDSNTSSASIADLQTEVSDTRQSLSRLVETARTQLAAGMSTTGIAKLDAFVQSQKTHIVVGVRSAQ